MAGSNGHQITTAQVPTQDRGRFLPASRNGRKAGGEPSQPSDFEIVSDPGGTRLAGEVPRDPPRPSFWRRNRKWFILAALAALITWAVIRFGVPRIREALNTVSTDDAFVAGHVTYVSPRIDDVVVEVLVDQNDRVEPGDLLVRLDRQPFELAVQQAEAAVEEARSNLALSRAGVQAQLAQARGNWFRRKNAQERIRQQLATLRSDVAALRARQSSLKLAELDQQRIANLAARGSASQSELDQRNDRLEEARQGVKEAWAEIQQTRAALGLEPNTDNPLEVPRDLEQQQSTVQQAVSEVSSVLAQVGIPFDLSQLSPEEAFQKILHLDSSQGIHEAFGDLVEKAPAVRVARAGLARAERELDNARLRLSYTEIRSEIGGYVQDRSVHPGNRVAPGQSLLSIRPHHVWIEANYKETQIHDIRIGHPVDIHVDAYPGKVFRGRVSGFSPGTGLSESLLPPENATGNYVKVTQRLPVRIELVDPNPTDTPLFVGLSVVPEVRFKERTTGPGAGRAPACPFHCRPSRHGHRSGRPQPGQPASGPGERRLMTRSAPTQRAAAHQPRSLDRAAPPRVNPWIVAITVTLATFMEVLDTSIANVALPHIAGSLSAGRSQSTWVLTSYLVANAIVLPISGWLIGMFGRKRFYMTCVALFTISSALCGAAPSLELLIFFRILQGAGGGGLQPSEQGILVDTFPLQQRGMAMAIYGVAVVVAPILGPTVGGWITDNYSWRWIFYINVPIGILSLFLTSMIVHDPPQMTEEIARNRRKGWNIDYVGLSLAALGFGSLEVVYAKGQEWDWLGDPFYRAGFPGDDVDWTGVPGDLGAAPSRPDSQSAPAGRAQFRRLRTAHVPFLRGTVRQ